MASTKLIATAVLAHLGSSIRSGACARQSRRGGSAWQFLEWIRRWVLGSDFVPGVDDEIDVRQGVDVRCMATRSSSSSSWTGSRRRRRGGGGRSLSTASRSAPTGQEQRWYGHTMDLESLARFLLPCPSPVPSPAAESLVDVDPFAFRGGGAAAASTPPAVGGPRMGSILPSRRSGAAVWTSCNPALTSRRGGAPLRLTSSRRKLTQAGYTSERGWQVRFTTLRRRKDRSSAHMQGRETEKRETPSFHLIFWSIDHAAYTTQAPPPSSSSETLNKVQ